MFVKVSIIASMADVVNPKVKEYSSQHFDYEFFGDYSEQQIDDFSKIQESDLQKISTYLSAKTLITKYRYKIFSTLKEKQQADPNHSVSHACARVGERTIYRVLGPEMETLSFPHELVHLIAHDIAPQYKWEVELDTYDGNKLQKTIEFDSVSFLQEGLAILIDELVFDNKLREAGEYRYVDDWVVYNRDKTNLMPHDLFDFYKSCAQPPLFATPICASFCKYLVLKYGIEEFMNVYTASSELKSEAENLRILEGNYDKSIVSLEEEWTRSLS